MLFNHLPSGLSRSVVVFFVVSYLSLFILTLLGCGRHEDKATFMVALSRLGHSITHRQFLHFISHLFLSPLVFLGLLVLRFIPCSFLYFLAIFSHDILILAIL